MEIMDWNVDLERGSFVPVSRGALSCLPSPVMMVGGFVEDARIHTDRRRPRTCPGEAVNPSFPFAP
jgi:hypothetical protein